MNKGNPVKNIIIVTISLLVIAGCGYFLFGRSKSSYKPQPVLPPQISETEITGEYDEETLGKVKNLTDYGLPPMGDIGRENPFADF